MIFVIVAMAELILGKSKGSHHKYEWRVGISQLAGSEWVNGSTNSIVKQI
jgi:hypothetical protein